MHYLVYVRQSYRRTGENTDADVSPEVQAKAAQAALPRGATSRGHRRHRRPPLGAHRGPRRLPGAHPPAVGPGRRGGRRVRPLAPRAERPAHAQPQARARPPRPPPRRVEPARQPLRHRRRPLPLRPALPRRAVPGRRRLRAHGGHHPRQARARRPQRRRPLRLPRRPRRARPRRPAAPPRGRARRGRPRAPRLRPLRRRRRLAGPAGGGAPRRGADAPRAAVGREGRAGRPAPRGPLPRQGRLPPRAGRPRGDPRADHHARRRRTSRGRRPRAASGRRQAGRSRDASTSSRSCSTAPAALRMRGETQVRRGASRGVALLPLPRPPGRPLRVGRLAHPRGRRRGHRARPPRGAPDAARGAALPARGAVAPDRISPTTGCAAGGRASRRP